MTHAISNELDKLMNWYQSNCDGEWEHDRRIRIGTIDNPGWSLEINFSETNVSGHTIPTTLEERTENNWLSFEVKEDVFYAWGGPGNLIELIQLFLEFTDSGKISLSQSREDSI